MKINIFLSIISIQQLLVIGSLGYRQRFSSKIKLFVNETKFAITCIDYFIVFF